MEPSVNATLAEIIRPMSVECFRDEFWGKRPLRIAGRVGKFAKYLPGELSLITPGRVDHLPTVAQLLEDLRASFEIPTRATDGDDQVSLFRSRDRDSPGWAEHWNLDHVFVLQLAGSKQWRYPRMPRVEWQKPALSVGAALGMFDAPSLLCTSRDDLEDVVLNEGDLFYMPPGVRHASIARGHSSHLAIAIGHQSLLDLMLERPMDERWMWSIGFKGHPFN